MPTPLVVLAGTCDRAVAGVADALVVPGCAVVHHHLAGIGEGVVHRRVRHGGGDQREVLELAHGCVSCTLREDVLPLLIRLAQAPGVDRIVLHLDPGMEPEAVCWALRHVLVDGHTVLEALRIEAVLTVIDAETWLADATGDEELAERRPGTLGDDERTVAQVVIGQVEFADAIVVAGGAPDIGTARRTDAVLDRLAPLAPRGRVAGLDIEALLAAVPPEARRGRLDRVHGPLLRGQPSLHAEHGVATVLFTSHRPFHPERLHDALQFLLEGVVRARGRVWVATQPDTALYLESAGEGLGIGHAGPWLAALDDWTGIDPERCAMAALRWDVRYGDREQALVVLIHDADPARIRKALTAALLTHDELDADASAWHDPFEEWHTDPCATAEHAGNPDNHKGHA